MKSISLRQEMGAYEAMWLAPGATFKSIADRFETPGVLPSDLVHEEEADRAYREAIDIIRTEGITSFGICMHGADGYPAALRDAKDPVEMLYYRGAWELAETPSVAIVGTRKPSDEGVRRARKLAHFLVKNEFTIVSGLAVGIDTAAHTAALAAGGHTVAVIGTAITDVYPRKNEELQAEIASDHLLVSQVPILRYSRQNWGQNRAFFPERSKTMSALSTATVIVEAGEASGTLAQGRAALYQGRKLFILDNLFHRRDLSWPAEFVEQGAIRVADFDQILEHARPAHR